jgi:hypothetical protein
MGRCRLNLCKVAKITCPDGGVCVPALGECQNASPCQSDSECVEGHVCLIDAETSEGVCTLEDAACGDGPGDGGCYGTMLCEYDAETLSAQCVESGSCTTAVDCAGDRQCSGQTCVEPMTCVNDEFEPNNADAEATVFASAALAGGLDAFICSGDTDVYTIDTQQLADLVRGTLTVTVDYAERDAGLGELKVELIDSDGATVATATSGSMGISGNAEVTAEITAAEQGEFKVRITDAGDVLTPGISYTLAVNFHSATSADACTNATRINPAQMISGDTGLAISSEFGSTCTGPHNLSSEDIYAFEVTENSEVTLELITADPDNTALTVNLSSDCGRLDTEIACVANGTDGKKVLTSVLAPGTYFAMVQAPVGATGGAYTLSLTMRPAYCSPADSYCVDADTASVCNEFGTGYNVKGCTAGCNSRTGECVRPQGDLCSIPLRKNSDFNATINWQDYRSDYQIPAGGCLPAVGESVDDTWSDGAEAVWAVEVAAQSAMTATLALPEGQGGSLYIFENCLQPAISCVAGTNALNEAGQQVLDFVNDTDMAKTIFLVADSSDASVMTAATLDVNIDPIICTPEATQCGGADLEICNAIGTAFEFERTCNFGCTAGVCNLPPNDTCQGAIPLVSGQPVVQNIAGYVNDYDFNDNDDITCFGTSSPGPEGVYVVTTTQPNQIIDVSLTATFDGVVYVTKSCVPTGIVPRCFVGADGPGDGGTETVSFVAAEAGDYYVYADAYDATVTGSFTLTATVTTPTCTPGQAIACNGNTLDYCDSTGTVQSYTCSTTCTNAACDVPVGEVCADAIVLADGDTVVDSLNGSNDIEIGPGRIGRCVTDAYDYTDGEENIYRVDLNAGDLLTVDVASDESGIMPFIAESCVSPAETCHVIDNNGYDGKLQYYAEVARSVFVIVDANTAYSVDDYTLSVDISQGSVCVPNSYSCLDATTMQICNNDGSAYLGQFTCATGCADGACVVDPGAELCTTAPSLGGITAPNIGTGIVVQANFGDLSDDISISASGCTNNEGDGNDLTYAVTLRPGDVLDASVYSSGLESPMVYVITDCGNPDGTCLAGAEYADTLNNGEVASVRYLSDVAQTVYVVADNEYDTADAPFRLEISVAPSECTTGQSSCLDPNTSQYCDQGFFVEQSCYFGCSTTGVCSPPPNDTCQTATVVPVDGAWHEYSGPMAEYTNQAQVSSTCGEISDYDSGHADAFFAVDLQAGDILEAEWTAGEGTLWLADDCATINNSCVDGVEVYGSPETYTFTAPTAGRYFIVGDNEFSVDANDIYTMRIKAETPQCDPATFTAACLDAYVLRSCEAPGFFSDSTCVFGCTAGACNPPTNDDFPGAVDVTSRASAAGGVTLAGGLWGNYANDSEGSGCGLSTGETDGYDAMFKVNLLAGQTVDATLNLTTNPGGTWFNDPAVYILDAGSDISSTNCLDGEQVNDAPASASYTATAAQTVWIVADGDDGSTSSAQAEEWELTVSIQ